MSETGPATQADDFYANALGYLGRSGVPCMIGGAYAMREYAGVIRDTKDLDVLSRVHPERPHVLLEIGAPSGLGASGTDGEETRPSAG